MSVFISKAITRGEKTELVWRLEGELPEGNIYFTAKRNYELASDRLIDKLCSKTYADGKTEVKAEIGTEDTQNLAYNVLVYDLTLVNAQGEETVLARGNLQVRFDVRTPYDGTPTDPEKYVPVKRSDFKEGEYIKATLINGEIGFTGYKSLRNGLFDIDINGDLTPKENPDFDDVYELDENGDIMPRTDI